MAAVIYFNAIDGEIVAPREVPGFGRELWVTDGTRAGTRMVKDINPDNDTLMGFRGSDPRFMTDLGDGRVIFRAKDATHGGRDELWVSDGTEAGTFMLKNIGGGSSSEPSEITAVRPGLVVFAARDGTNAEAGHTGRELWVSDGTREGTRLLKDINPGVDDDGRALSSNPQHFLSLGNGYVVFTADDGVHGREVWSTDGTSEGTRMLGDIRPGSADGVVELTPRVEFDVWHLVRPGRALFRADDGIHGREVWTTDGRSVQLLKNVFDGDPGAYSFDFRALPSGVTEIRASGIPGATPLMASFLTDGTPGGTNPGSAYGSVLLDGSRLSVQDWGPFDDRGLYYRGDQVSKDIRSLGQSQEFSRGNVVLVATDTDGERALYTFNSTGRSLHKVLDGVESFSFFGPELPGGRWLLSLRTGMEEVEPGRFRPTVALGISDGTPGGTRLLSDSIVPANMEQITPLGRSQIVFAYNDGVHNREPWVMDLGSGSARMLADIAPGNIDSNPGHFAMVWTDGVPVPTSTLFTHFASMEGETPVIVLDDYFSDASQIEYFVNDLPRGAVLDEEAAKIVVTPEIETGRHNPQVVATNDIGGATAAAFDWEVVDTGALRIVSSNGWGRTGDDAPILSAPGSVIRIGHKQGDASHAEGFLFRIESTGAAMRDGGAAEVRGNVLTLKGKLFSELVPTDKPLMEGSFKVDMRTLNVTEFKDDKTTDSLRLVKDMIDLHFSDLAINPDGIVLRTDLLFMERGEVFEGVSTTGGPLALHLTTEGPSFGPGLLTTGRWNFGDALKFDLGGASNMQLNFSDIGLDYDMVNDALYMSGKAKLAWGGKVAREYSFLDDGRQSTLTLDLVGKDQPDLFARGDKYLRIGTDATGRTYDFVGEIVYEAKGSKTVPAAAPALKKLTFELDTVKKTFGGSFEAKLPFLFKGLDLEGKIGAKWDPVEIDSFLFGLDGLNKPLGTTGLFVQGGTLGAKDLATRDATKPPSVTAQINMTLGPHDEELWVSPLHGHIGGELKAAQVTVDIAATSKVEYLLPGEIERMAGQLTRWLGLKEEDILKFELVKVAGKASVDFARSGFAMEAEGLLLGGVLSGQMGMSTFVDDKGHTQAKAAISAMARIPDALPLIGGISRSADGRLVTSADGDNSNDYAAFWTTYSVPFGLFGGTRAAGLRYWLDGRAEVLGLREITAIGSWALAPEQELVILSARWDTPVPDARLELIAPGGKIIPESEFGNHPELAAGIAIVDDLTSPTGRHVALHHPMAGIWDVRMVDASGLGEVRTEASEILQSPLAQITDVVVDAAAATAVVEVDVVLGDAAAAELAFFVAETAQAAVGLPLAATAPVTVAADGVLSHGLDIAGLAPGQWWVQVHTEADGMVPGLDVFATPITIEGAADLGLEEIREGRLDSPDQRVVTVTVANSGGRNAGEAVLEVTAPAVLTGAPGQGDIPGLVAEVTRFALPDLAPGARTELGFAVPVGAALAGEALILEVSGPVWDADMSDNLIAYVLGGLMASLEGALHDRAGRALEGLELSVTLPDGARVAVTTDAEGRFAFDTVSGTEGVLDGLRSWTPATDPSITTASALEALRMAVGLPASWGPPGPLDFIAADINGDGRVTTADALEILRSAVGLPSATPPRWIVFDAGHDFGEVTSAAVPREFGIDLAALADPMQPMDLTALLVGHVAHYP